MIIKFLLEIFLKNKDSKAIIWENKHYSYNWLLDRFHFYNLKIKDSKIIKQGCVVIFESDFTPNSIAIFLALINQKCIIVPLTESVEEKKKDYIFISQGEVKIKIDHKDDLQLSKINQIAEHDLYDDLRNKSDPGLVLFSSGSTGQSKASVHNIRGLLKKYKVPRNKYNTITFLLFDHIGGFNTLFYTLSNSGLIVSVLDRDPRQILKMIQDYNVELLPTTPTFLNLIILSESYKKYNLKSLKIITYGTEPMPKSTLIKINSILPHVKLIQTYGLSELGILRSKSKSSKSLWVKVGGAEFKTRIRNNELEIKSESLMLGYLNAPSPIMKDGWFKTGDLVEQNGEYIKILGRSSEIISVGGEKVFPQEVENVLFDLENVLEVLVYGEKNLITGNIVCARFLLKNPEDKNIFHKRMHQHCEKRIEKFKIPIKIDFTNESLHNVRFKKERTI